MKQLTSIKPLQHFLENRLARHVRVLQNLDKNNFDEHQISECCNHPVIHEGSHTYCGYCFDPIISEV